MKDVILREITVDDLELIRTWRSSESISKYMYTTPNITPEQQLAWYAKMQESKTSKYWMITYEGKPLGVASLYNINDQFKNSYWAFYLGDSSVRGKGVGSKVEFQVCEYVFDTMGYNKLLCEVFVWNTAVVKMHEKFGFRRESYFRQHVFKNEKWEDVIGMAMLKQEWDQQKKYLFEKITKR